jgi:hypothetical protein
MTGTWRVFGFSIARDDIQVQNAIQTVEEIAHPENATVFLCCNCSHFSQFSIMKKALSDDNPASKAAS